MVKEKLNKNGIEISSSWLSRWPEWSGYVAAIWSFLYGVLGLFWSLGGSGFPYGENDVRGQMMGSFLTNMNPDLGGMLILIIGMTGSVIAWSTVQKWRHWIPRVVFLTFAWFMCVILVFVIPDARMIQNFAYLFALHFDLIDWPVINQVLCIVGGFLWGAAALAYGRHTRGACGNCGRVHDLPGNSVKSAAKWGKWVTYIAVVMALPYGIVRWAWAIGIPLGTNDSTLIGNTDMISMEILLGSLCFVGAILTLGLIQTWGEIFPSWCFFLAGKRIPIWFVVIPSTLMSTIITITGVKLTPQIIYMIADGSIHAGNWGGFVPFLFWLPWGISLGAATFVYYIRRRGRCKHCGSL